MLDAAGRPLRARRGLPEPDRLVLLALLTTGLRRAELLGLDWRDVDLDPRNPSVLVRAKGNRPRRHPLAASLARDLADLKRSREPAGDDPVFCGLQGARLQATVLAEIIRRAAERAGNDKKVTAHTLRHSAATWLRQDTGDARLVAEYLGHADLSTVSRYARVAARELQMAADSLAVHAGAAGAGRRRPRPPVEFRRVTEEPTGRKRRWRDYRSSSGRRPVKEFLDSLKAGDVAEIVAAMRDVERNGLSVARHLRGDIYEVRADGDGQTFRILFAPEGRSKTILLALDGFSKKTQKTPPAKLTLAERRLRDWRSRG